MVKIQINLQEVISELIQILFILGGFPHFQLDCFTLALFHLVLSVFTTSAKCIPEKPYTAMAFLIFTF